MRKYNVNGEYGNDFDTPEEAISVVEAAGRGSVVLFFGSPNIRGCLPATVYRSCAMWQYHDGKWYSYSIFSANCEKLEEERPH